MKDILSELYVGNISPLDQYFPSDPEYERLVRLYSNHCDEFEKKLAALDPPLDSEFTELLEELFSVYSCERFELFGSSFRLGARMMLEMVGKELFE